MRKEEAEADKIQNKIEVMEEKIPDAMTGEYALSLDELVTLIRKPKRGVGAATGSDKREKACLPKCGGICRRLGGTEKEDSHLAGSFPKCRHRSQTGAGEPPDQKDRSKER